MFRIKVIIYKIFIKMVLIKTQLKYFKNGQVFITSVKKFIMDNKNIKNSYLKGENKEKCVIIDRLVTPLKFCYIKQVTYRLYICIYSKQIPFYFISLERSSFKLQFEFEPCFLYSV